MVNTNYASSSILDKYRLKSTSKKSKLSKKDTLALLATNWSALTIWSSKLAKDSTNK